MLNDVLSGVPHAKHCLGIASDTHHLHCASEGSVRQHIIITGGEGVGLSSRSTSDSRGIFMPHLSALSHKISTFQGYDNKVEIMKCKFYEPEGSV